MPQCFMTFNEAFFQRIARIMRISHSSVCLRQSLWSDLMLLPDLTCGLDTMLYYLCAGFLGLSRSDAVRLLLLRPVLERPLVYTQGTQSSVYEAPNLSRHDAETLTLHTVHLACEFRGTLQQSQSSSIAVSPPPSSPNTSSILPVPSSSSSSPA